MIAILVFPPSTGDSGSWSPLTDTCLLPLFDRPMLQHVVESLADNGVTLVHALLPYFDGPREDFLGDGSRWGLRIRTWYGLTPSDEVILDSIRQADDADVRVLVGQADCLPSLAQLPMTASSYKIVIDTEDQTRNWLSLALPDASTLLHAGKFENLPSVHERTALDASTPQRLLRSQKAILTREYKIGYVFAKEEQPGVWIGRNAHIHPSATLVPPVYIGASAHVERDATVGPHAVVSTRGSIGEATVVHDALIGDHTSIGAHLRIAEGILLGNMLHSVPQATFLQISDKVLATEN